MVAAVAMLLLEQPLPGHGASPGELKHFGLRKTSWTGLATWNLVPDGLLPLGLPDAELTARGGPPGSPWMVIACAEDRTTAGAAIRYWTTALKHKDPRFRSLAARALGEMRDQAAVPALIEALKDEVADVRLTAIQALGRIGPGAEPAVAALREALKDKQQAIRAEVARTLEKIQHPR